jgi:hypothetical protein
MDRILPFVSLSAGFGLGVWYGHSKVPRAAEAVSGTPVTTQLTSRPNEVAHTSSDLSTLRNLIREELALAKKDDATAVIRAQPEAPPSSEILAERRNALAEIDGLTAGGVWDDEQRIRFHNDLQILDAGERKHALQQLVLGINSGAIKVKLHGGPLM